MLKKLLKAMAVFLLAVVTWVTVFSFVDGPPVEEGPLVSTLAPLPDEENGYLDFLALGQDETLSGLPPTIWNPEKAHLDHQACNALAQHDARVQEIRNIISNAVSRPGFRQPRLLPSSDLSRPFPGWVRAVRVLLLKSRCAASAGALESAYQDLGLVSGLLHLLQGDSNKSIIFYAVLVRLLTDFGEAVEAIARSEPEAVAALADVVARAPVLTAADFHQALGGEYLYIKAVLLDEVTGPLTERIARLGAGYQSCTLYLASDVCSEGLTLRFMASLLPGYYLQRNRTSAGLRDQYLALSSRAAREGCNMAASAADDERARDKTLDYVRPNGMGRWFIRNAHPGELLPPYFLRACLANTYLAGLQVAFAAERFRHEQGHYPVELHQLVPAYLSALALDPFSGGPLKYDARAGWVYSVGQNGVNEGGTLKSTFHYRCAEDEACYNNLTIPLLHHAQPASSPTDKKSSAPRAADAA